MKLFQKVAVILTVNFIVLISRGPVCLAEVDTQTVPVTVTIKPAFILKAESLEGLPMVKLGPMIPEVEVRPSILRVSIYTNTRKRYRIFHEWVVPRNSSNGESIQDEKINLRVIAGQKGTQSFMVEPQILKAGRQLIFQSDGGSDSFDMEYNADNKRLYEAGLYDGHIRLTAERD